MFPNNLYIFSIEPLEISDNSFRSKLNENRHVHIRAKGRNMCVRECKPLEFNVLLDYSLKFRNELKITSPFVYSASTRNIYCKYWIIPKRFSCSLRVLGALLKGRSAVVKDGKQKQTLQKCLQWMKVKFMITETKVPHS